MSTITKVLLSTQSWKKQFSPQAQPRGNTIVVVAGVRFKSQQLAQTIGSRGSWTLCISKHWPLQRSYKRLPAYDDRFPASCQGAL
eukprot:3723392-Pleurochrysis_carterae.AAC.4